MSATAALRSAFPEGSAHSHPIHACDPGGLMLTHPALNSLTDSVIKVSR
jgi:hypothetical protein